MNLSGGDVLLRDLPPIEHAGVKGMRWGVRKTPGQKAAAQKDRANKKAVKKADKHKLKIASKMNAGEVVVSALAGGPVGLVAYSAIKRSAAKSKLKNKHESEERQAEIAGKIKVGRAIAVTVVTGPVGLVGYAVAKAAAADQVESF